MNLRFKADPAADPDVSLVVVSGGHEENSMNRMKGVLAMVA